MDQETEDKQVRRRSRLSISSILPSSINLLKQPYNPKRTEARTSSAPRKALDKIEWEKQY